MGFLKKAKEAAQEAAQQAQQAFGQQPGFGQQQPGAVHVQGAGLIDPAVLGGPSTRSVAGDDPIWQPINGISLQDYADFARECQARGTNTEEGLIAVAGEKGFSAEDAKTAVDGWVQRMGQSMAVGQQFRKFLGY